MAVLTNVGKAILTGRLLAAPNPSPQYIGFGTGATAEAVTQTALATEVGTRSVAATQLQFTTLVTNDSFRWVGTVQSPGTPTIAEAALFDASSGGNMFIRTLVAPVIPLVSATDAITFTFETQF